MFAILLPLFMIGGAIVVDVGYWWANARKAQIAADACALAAARDLPQTWNRTECVHDGRDYVLTNLPPQGVDSEPVHVSTKVISPFEGDATLVEATVNMKVRTFFGRYVGLGGVELTRRAVAEQSVGEGRYAIYAHSAGCPTTGGTSLLFGGEHHTINGRVHSNGEYRVNNSDSTPRTSRSGRRRARSSGRATTTTRPTRGTSAGRATRARRRPSRRRSRRSRTGPVGGRPQLRMDGRPGCGRHVRRQGRSRSRSRRSAAAPRSSSTRSSARRPQAASARSPARRSRTRTSTAPGKKFTIDRDESRGDDVRALARDHGQRQRPASDRVQGQRLRRGPVLLGSEHHAASPTARTASPTVASPASAPRRPAARSSLTLNGNDHQWTGVVFAPCARVKVNVGGTTAGNTTSPGPSSATRSR